MSKQEMMKKATDKADWVRQQGWQQGHLHREFLIQQLKDPSLVDEFIRQNLKRARQTALLLGSVLIISLISIVYAFIQNALAVEQEFDLSKRAAELNQCETESTKQQALAEESYIIGLEALERAQETLSSCQDIRSSQ